MEFVINEVKASKDRPEMLTDDNKLNPTQSSKRKTEEDSEAEIKQLINEKLAIEQ